MTTEGNFEMMDYITSLREGIMDAWDGIIIAMKSSGKSTSVTTTIDQVLITTAQILAQYLDSIFELLRIVQSDANRTEALLRSSCGVIGYVYCCWHF
jgi:importin subunit beta-1